MKLILIINVTTSALALVVFGLTVANYHQVHDLSQQESSSVEQIIARSLLGFCILAVISSLIGTSVTARRYIDHHFRHREQAAAPNELTISEEEEQEEIDSL